MTTADKDHLHHRLMRLGHGQRRSVVILWAWTALLSAFVLYPAYTGKGDALVPLGDRGTLPAPVHGPVARRGTTGRATPTWPDRRTSRPSHPATWTRKRLRFAALRPHCIDC